MGGGAALPAPDRRVALFSVCNLLAEVLDVPTDVNSSACPRLGVFAPSQIEPVPAVSCEQFVLSLRDKHLVTFWVGVMGEVIQSELTARNSFHPPS